MHLKLVGMALIVIAAGWTGFGAAASVRKQIQQLEQLRSVLELMHCEISCRLTPLRKLCMQISDAARGEVARYFALLGEALERGDSIQAATEAAEKQKKLLRFPLQIQAQLDELLASFGVYDAAGQLRMIELTQAKVDQALAGLHAEKRSRCRCYRVLGICTGFALAILVA